MCLNSVWILSEVDIENTRLRPVTLSDVYIVNFQHDFGYWMVALFLNTLLWAVFLYVWPSNSGGGGEIVEFLVGVKVCKKLIHQCFSLCFCRCDTVISLLHLKPAIARAHTPVHAPLLMRVKIVRATSAYHTYCLGHWNEDNESKNKNISFNTWLLFFNFC